MSNISNIGVNYFTLGFFHKMLFDILNNHSYNLYGKEYKELENSDKVSVWGQVRIIFDSKIETLGDDEFYGYKLEE